MVIGSLFDIAQNNRSVDPCYQLVADNFSRTENGRPAARRIFVDIPVVGAVVTFTVISGPNLNTTGTGTTNAAGQATFTYTSTVRGTDFVHAQFVDSRGATQTSGNSQITWIGGTAPVITSAPNTTFTVGSAGSFTVTATGAPAPRYFMGNEAFNANFPVRYDSRVFVKKAPAVSTAAALAAVRGVATKYSGTTVMDQAAFKAQQAKPIQQMLSLVYALLALAILIALLGIGNTLALSIFERTRELGVMRAVGMTRHQLRAMIRWESVIIALQGTVLGLLIGVFFGWALVLAMGSQGITEFSIPVLNLVIVVLLASLAGAAAAIWPSRRAAKLNILRAIVTE